MGSWWQLTGSPSMKIDNLRILVDYCLPWFPLEINPKGLYGYFLIAISQEKVWYRKHEMIYIFDMWLKQKRYL